MNPKCLLVFFCTAIGLPLAALSQDEPDYKTTGPVLVLPDHSPDTARYYPSSSEGLALSNVTFKSGKGWWILSCETTCKITPSTLTVSEGQYSQYDDLSYKVLQWSPVPTGNTLLMFKPLHVPAHTLKLSAGPITTYYPIDGDSIEKAMSVRAKEAELLLLDGTRAQLLPVLVLPDSKSDQSKGVISLELRIGEQRQTLVQGNFIVQDNYIFSPKEYLPWSGDMDNDGKLDVLIRSGFCGSVALFLSSLAKPGELVGEAGRFEYLPLAGNNC
ncbi:MAG: hypothetical protein PHR16_00920 [Methylovulum sp.]|nr:hypothetical protein [Methylovulum sp.]